LCQSLILAVQLYITELIIVSVLHKHFAQ